jgi:hypothetical protein
MDDIAPPPTATQDAIPALADDLLKDRIRQFLEFLDDEVRGLFSTQKKLAQARRG